MKCDHSLNGLCPTCYRLPTPEMVLNDPAASNWLKVALKTALQRDPVDAANDAAFLGDILNQRVTFVKEQTS